jgi:hypothetical protein
LNEISGVTICPTVVWAKNATTVAGSRTGSSGSSLTRLNAPIGVIVNNNGSIYVADSSNFRVLRFPPNSGTGILVINSTSGTQLNQFSSSKYSIDRLIIVLFVSCSG